MRKYIFMKAAFLFLLFGNCKSYTVLNDARVQSLTNSENNLEAIRLADYSFYKREIYYHYDEKTGEIYKGPDKTCNGKNKCIRYEIQFIAIEKSAGPRNIIHFSYIPPHQRYDDYIFNMAPYEDPDLVNINDINYINFGKLDGGTLTLIRKKLISVWNVEINDPVVSITRVAFADRGKTADVKTRDYLPNKAEYKKLDNPKMILHAFPGRCISDANSDYLKDQVLYYDQVENQVYFEFSAPLHSDSDYTWIRYSDTRVRSNYIKN